MAEILSSNKNQYIRLQSEEKQQHKMSKIKSSSRVVSSGSGTYTYLFKCVFIGDAITGKSNFLLQFTEKRFRPNYDKTIGVEFGTQCISIDNKVIKLQIWDTAGSIQFRSITRSYYRGAAICLLFYDITNRQTFEHIDDWIREAYEHGNQNMTIVLVANKYDLESKREVSYNEGETKANEYNIIFMETSAKSGMNVDNIMLMVAELVYDKIKLGIYDMQNETYGIKVGGATSAISVQKSAPQTHAFMGGNMFSSSGDVSLDLVERDKNSKFIDNIFADLENLFYILARIIYPCHCYYSVCCSDNMYIGLTCFFCFHIFEKLAVIFIFYPLVFIISLVIILPSCIFLLIVRASKVETDTKDLKQREEVLAHETCCQRFKRFIMQLIRSIFMFIFLAIYPIFIMYFIIPHYGYSNSIILPFIGAYFIILLILQTFGTYRGLKSFSKRREEQFFVDKSKNKNKNTTQSSFRPKFWNWNIGSIIGIILILYEIFQLTLFSNHVINTTNGSSSSSSSKIN
eukprot:362819_1